MHLILWRHAEAEDGRDDLARALTARGQHEAQRSAAWLKDQLRERPVRVLASQARRAQQTALAFTPQFGIDPRLNPDVPAASYLAAAGWPHADTAVLLVGHQPTLGWLASLLLAGTELDWDVRKSGVWWLEYHPGGGMQARLDAVYAPS
ncbi:histidine phosphatase family protein [Chitiniphilus purpureus]|uniref:Histidine phosphatase family protein n=1 Tax=Chitiniphilus purpureus TaxID=2981137 RepID=A0ABY6DVI8_9NEIS|nr:histidine phosphatase family protein [Chitiniphilus sp. CD1]UXY15868.1 histidine phosphatase family protein [Chitiniphilus sp. CD1]